MPPADLVAGWHAQLAAAGYNPDGLLQSLEQAAAGRGRDGPATLDGPQLSALAAYLLGLSERLANQKVFTRADAPVVAGTLLFGFGPSELLRVVEAVCAHPDAVALMGVKAAREQAYAPACAIANEAAIALKAALQAEPATPPPWAPRRSARPYQTRKPSSTAARSGPARRPWSLPWPPPGGAWSSSWEWPVRERAPPSTPPVRRSKAPRSGCRETAVSGQAARTLGTEAGIDDPRTVASLLWRIDHGQLNLDNRTVVCCDEAGMADDPAMLRLLAATEAAGSKLVIIGDHRQVGAVGPGGSLEALVAHYGGGVHVLTENVRQADPDERAVLTELRAGEVDKAVDWYAGHQRVKLAPGRDEVLDQMVAAWAKDVAEGKETAMLAWRRANVAALNSRARAAMAQAGRLSGPELHAGANVYQAGDRVVTLAPSAHGKLVTSQRGEVVAVDPEAQILTVRMDDRSTHTLGPEETAPDRLAHG